MTEPNTFWDCIFRWRLRRFRGRASRDFANRYTGSAVDLVPDWSALEGILSFPKQPTRLDRVLIFLGLREPPPPPKRYVANIRIRRPGKLSTARTQRSETR